MCCPSCPFSLPPATGHGLGSTWNLIWHIYYLVTTQSRRALTPLLTLMTLPDVICVSLSRSDFPSVPALFTTVCFSSPGRLGQGRGQLNECSSAVCRCVLRIEAVRRCSIEFWSCRYVLRLTLCILVILIALVFNRQNKEVLKDLNSHAVYIEYLFAYFGFEHGLYQYWLIKLKGNWAHGSFFLKVQNTGLVILAIYSAWSILTMPIRS